MKKIVLTLLLIVAVGCASAQTIRTAGPDVRRNARIQAVEKMCIPSMEKMSKGTKPYRMTKFYTDDYYDIQYFSYDEDDRLIAASDSLNADADSYFVIDSMHYDAQGHLVRLAGWQYFSGVPKNVYYIDYTYDSRGDLVSRTNYNFYDDQWNLGGVYNYVYNDNHQMVYCTLTMMNRVFQRVERQYEEGRMVKETWLGYDYDCNCLLPNEADWYRYDDRGLLVRRDDSVSDDGTTWEYLGLHTYAYDGRGNCTLYEHFDYTGTISERSEYRYDFGIYQADVTMPWNPEEPERPKIATNYNALSTESWWTVDVDHNLQYVCDYIYEYNGHGVGIREAEARPLAVSPNPASGRVAIEGLGDAPVRVLLSDAAGRQVMSALLSAASNTIDVSSLAPGVYILSAGGRTAKLLVK